MDGFLFIDKEKGSTSFDVIRALKRKIREADPGVSKKFKIGHCGTLDPIATGLMIVALGEACKLLEFLLGADKVYRAQCEFGAISDTYDADGQVEKVAGVESVSPGVSLDVIKKVVQEGFVGEIEQMPPKFSAKKINGKRACDLVREGKEVKLKPKKVQIYNVDFVSYEWPLLEFEMSCGSGTYVRSVVHDLGQELKVGAYMTALRRTEIGFFEGGLRRGFSVDGAVTLDEMGDDVEKFLQPVEEMFENFPSIELNGADFKRLSNGGFVLNKAFGALETLGTLGALGTLNKKNVQKEDVLAKYGGKVVGVVELMKGEKLIKFRKRINIPA